MKSFILCLLLISFAICTDTMDVEWINSKYHNIGAHWYVFGGLVGFITIIQLLGLGVEWWYKKKLHDFLETEDINDSNQY